MENEESSGTLHRLNLCAFGSIVDVCRRGCAHNVSRGRAFLKLGSTHVHDDMCNVQSESSQLVRRTARGSC